MMKYVLALLLTLTLVGCAQSPTTTTQVIDDRPGLTFDITTEAAKGYQLRIDGISYGEVGQYQLGENLLKIVNGTHHIELLNNGQVVFSQEVYLGSGVTRVIKVGVQ